MCRRVMAEYYSFCNVHNRHLQCKIYITIISETAKHCGSGPENTEQLRSTFLRKLFSVYIMITATENTTNFLPGEESPEDVCCITERTCKIQ